MHSLSIVLVALQHRPWSLAELCAPPGSQGDGLRKEGGLLVPVSGSFQPHLTTLSCSGQRWFWVLSGLFKLKILASPFGFAGRDSVLETS